MTTTPRLSIGLPVYNGENYLTEALDDLLGQTYTDFELIISDNASTDATERICRAYADADPRVRYIRQPRNIGAVPNHNFLVGQARGELFKWAAHDDRFGDTLLERCVAALDTEPDAVLCHSHMAVVDADGTLAEKYDYTIATDSPSAPERFKSLLVTDGGDDFYGVVRLDVMRRAPRMDSYHNGGRVFVAGLSLYGRFLQVPEVLYFRRDHPGRGDRLPSISAVCSNLDPRRANHSTARLLAEYVGGYLSVIRRSPLSPRDRAACYRAILGWFAGRGMRIPARRLAFARVLPSFGAGQVDTSGSSESSTLRERKRR
ncbi:glycosyltransferase family 2 protein [Haloechinothrix salitolerans]|uniref:Glycosyltransferase family 2 protein n=1 Tax=Haloechinothrix salitolerans TaxID=926830 RepID=A0ABW2C603_9PSEU